MKRTFTMLTFLILLLSVTALTAGDKFERRGGFARLLAMGNNVYVMDPYFMTVNPAWGAYYDNMIFGDLGSTATPFGNNGNGQFAGANFRIMKNLTIGGLLSRNDFTGISIARLDPFGLVGQLNNAVGAGSVVALNNNLELMATFGVDKFNLGLGVAYASSTKETTPANGQTTTGSASQIGINAGLVAELTKMFKIDAGVSLALPSAKFAPGGGQETKISQTILSVNGRVFVQFNKDLAFVPAITFLTASGKVEAANSRDLPSITLITAGFGINYTVGDFLLAGGPAVIYQKNTTASVANVSPELTTSSLSFPVWNLGAEWSMLDWLVARLGYVAVTTKVTSEAAANANDVNENVTTIYGLPLVGLPNGATVGLGFILGNFSLDATVNVDVLRQGLANFGNSGAGATFGYLSASYHW